MRNHSKYISKLIVASLLGIIITAPVLAQSSNIKLRSIIDKSYPAIDLKSGIKIDKYNRPINLSLRDSDLRQVLRMLADKAEQNIVIDDSVSGKVTLDLNNTNVNKAFDYVMTLNQLTYWKDENTIVVATVERANKLGLNRLKIKPIKVKYIDASIVANFLNKSVFSSSRPGDSSAPNTVVNSKTNEILVFGNDSDIAIAQKVVDYVDVKQKIKVFDINFTEVNKIAQIICDQVFNTQLRTDANAAMPGIMPATVPGATPAATPGIMPTMTPAMTNAGGIPVNICSSVTFENPSDLTSLDVLAYSVVPNPSLNQVTIYGGTEEQVDLAGELVKKFDRRQPQVYIEISIIELSNNAQKNLTNRWDYANGGFNYSFDTVTNKIDNFAYMGNAANAARSLTQTIEMLVQENKARILANPKIIAANNIKSKIDLSEEYVKSRRQEAQVATLTSGNATTNLLTETYEYGDAGIQVEITPKISPNGYVTLNLKPTYTTVGSDVFDSQKNLVGKLTKKRDLELSGVRVKDGSTLIIGGLTQENETKNINKIPILCDIPVIGAFFKSTTTNKIRSELILMITPKILKDDDEDTNNSSIYI